MIDTKCRFEIRNAKSVDYIKKTRFFKYRINFFFFFFQLCPSKLGLIFKRVEIFYHINF